MRSHWRRSAFRPATAAASPFSRPIRSARDRSCSPCPPRRSRRRIRGFTTHSQPTGLPQERPCCASRWPGSRSWRRGRTATKSNRSKFSDRGVGSTDGIAPGTDVKHLFENGGISQTDNDGRLVITLNGMTYRVSGLGEEGRKKLGKAHADGVTPAHLAAGFRPRRQSDEHPDQLTARKETAAARRRHSAPADAGAARQQPTPAPRCGRAAEQRDSGTARHRRDTATLVRVRQNGCGNPHPPPHPETLPAGAPFSHPFCTL